MFPQRSMVVEMVPLKGGRLVGSIFVPSRFGKDYKWYISGKKTCQLGDGLCHRSHLLGEPKTEADYLVLWVPPDTVV